jgi:two-component system chemotaxis response regulator CheB
MFGKNAVGVLLTGMGKDGAVELKLMKEKGAVTIVQNMESSAVYGMPGEAVKIGAAKYVLPADRIAAVLTSIAMSK